MEAYKNFGVNRALRLSEILILVAITSMYSGVLLAIVAKLIH